MINKSPHKQHRQKGQSLVEVALFFPILVILLAGVVELSQLVITQNRVSNAARTAARFGANGGEDSGMAVVAINSITQTLEVTPDKWDMWVIHGQVNEEGDEITDEDFTFEHTFGISNTQLFSTVVPANIKAEIWEELQRDETAGAATAEELAELRFVGTYILHDVDSIIGLDAFPALANFSSVRALTVMRVTGINIEQTRGCDAFPIGVNEVNFRSLTNPDGSNPYPNSSDFTYPFNPPDYEFFVNHETNKPIRSAQEGYLFKFDAATFKWLKWNTLYLPDDVTALTHSMDWPGDSQDYDTYGYYEPGEGADGDKSLNIGDYVAVSTATMSDITGILQKHVDRERTLRVVLYDSVEAGTGNIHISGFAVFRIVGFNTSQNWMIAEFLWMDESCGQEIDDTP